MREINGIKEGKREINGEKLEVKNVACMDNAG